MLFKARPVDLYAEKSFWRKVVVFRQGLGNWVLTWFLWQLGM